MKRVKIQNWQAFKITVLLVGIVSAFGVAFVASQTSVIAAVNCTPTDKLVNPCRPWLGGFSFDSGSLIADIEGKSGVAAGLEPRTNKKLDVVRAYIPSGKYAINKESKYFIDRPNTVLFTNYKPSVPWREGDGRNATINSQIDQMADSINTSVPEGKKIMLSIDAEPEDDVSSLDTETANQCPAQSLKAKTQSGTPQEYRDMWRNVRSRFDSKGTSNKVVWVMNYMGYKNWDCLVKPLYPGDDLVDWVTWDPYVSGDTSWNQEISRFYTFLEQSADSTHQFTAKPWGLAEYGSWHTIQEKAYQMYNEAKVAAEANAYPRLKLYTIFDSSGTNNSKIEYSFSNQRDPQELGEYSKFAQSKAFTDPISESDMLPNSLDFKNNTGIPVIEVKIPITPPTRNGLQASYYKNNDRRSVPVKQIDKNIDFNWNRSHLTNGVGKNFVNVRWTGKLTVPKTDPYTFTFKGDDGFKVWIDGKQVISAWRPQAITAYRTKQINLEAGKAYDLKIEYFELAGLASAKFSWQSPSIPKAVVPTSALSW